MTSYGVEGLGGRKMTRVINTVLLVIGLIGAWFVIRLFLPPPRTPLATQELATVRKWCLDELLIHRKDTYGFTIRPAQPMWDGHQWTWTNIYQIPLDEDSFHLDRFTCTVTGTTNRDAKASITLRY